MAARSPPLFLKQFMCLPGYGIEHEKFLRENKCESGLQKGPALAGVARSAAAAGRNWLQLECAGWLKFRAEAKPRPDSGPGLVSTALHAAAQSGNIPRLSPAWAGRSL